MIVPLSPVGTSVSRLPDHRWFTPRLDKPRADRGHLVASRDGWHFAARARRLAPDIPAFGLARTSVGDRSADAQCAASREAAVNGASAWAVGRGRGDEQVDRRPVRAALLSGGTVIVQSSAGCSAACGLRIPVRFAEPWAMTRANRSRSQRAAWPRPRRWLRSLGQERRGRLSSITLRRRSSASGWRAMMPLASSASMMATIVVRHLQSARRGPRSMCQFGRPPIVVALELRVSERGPHRPWLRPGLGCEWVTLGGRRFCRAS